MVEGAAVPFFSRIYPVLEGVLCPGNGLTFPLGHGLPHVPLWGPPSVVAEPQFGNDALGEGLVLH